MFTPSEFHDLVSGRRRGLLASLARAGLSVLEIPYALAVQWRNRRYDRGRAEIHRVGVPVISVGNLTLGGTGKTPLVAWLARWFRDRDVRVTIVSRGYGAAAGSRNDEAIELEQRLPDVPHLQNPHRVEAAQMAVDEFDCQLILLDDGFQHRRLGRDLDIVLIDALEPFGYNHVFPRGALREPIAGLRRAQVVALSRADLVDAATKEAIRQRVKRVAPEAVWLELAHAPQSLLSATGSEQPLSLLAGQRVAAFCGIGNPAGFRHTLEQCGYQVVALREFPDHHPYSRDDVQSLERWAAELDAQAIVCTHKDLVKIGLVTLGSRPLWAVTIGAEVRAGRQELQSRLDGFVPILARASG